jgi:hypothetical protein
MSDATGYHLLSPKRRERFDYERPLTKKLTKKGF